MFPHIHNRLCAPSQRALFTACAALTGLTFLTPSSLHAEGLDRVYEVEAHITPTTLVSQAPGPLTTLTLKVSPNDRKKMTRVEVNQEHNAYKVSAYRLRVRLKPNNDGSNDNGTLSYSLSAAVEHTVGSHTASLLPHTHGTIPLHQGNGQINLPANKYFSGDISIKAIASTF